MTLNILWWVAFFVFGLALQQASWGGKGCDRIPYTVF